MTGRLAVLTGVLVSCLAPAIAAGQDADAILDLGQFRGRKGTYVFGLDDIARGPQYALCHNPVDDEYFVVFQATKPGTADMAGLLMGQRVDAATGARKGDPILIDDGELGSGGGSDDQISAPSIAHCPSTNRYMVCYRWFSFPFMTILDAQGAKLAPAGNNAFGFGRMTLNEAMVSGWNLGWWEAPIAVDADGSGFMVAFVDWTNSYDYDVGALWGRRFDANGRATGAKFRIADISDMHAIRHLGGPANRYLVAYTSPALGWEEPDTRPSISTVMLTLDENRVTIGPERRLPSATSWRHLWPRIAANATDQEWLVVWEATDTNLWSGYGVSDFWDWIEKPPSIGGIEFARVDGSGLPIGGGGLSPNASVNLAPDVTWSNVDNVYLIHWRAGTAIAGAKITGGSGTIIKEGFPIDGNGLEKDAPFLCVRPGSSRALSIRGAGTALEGRIVNVISRPALPANLVQFQVEGATPVGQGGSTRGSTVVIQAVVNDPEDDSLLLELQVLEAGTPFADDAPTHSATARVTSGGTGRVTVTGLPLDTPHHWRARAKNSFGMSSGWLHFPADPAFVTKANAPPSFSGIGQSAPGGRPLAPGSRVFDSILLAAATVDEDPSLVQFHAEIRPLGTAFSGTANASGRMTAAGTIELMAHLSPDVYHWQYRATDPFGGDSGWRSFGANAETEADFEALPAGSEGPASCFHSAGGVPALGMMALLAGLPLLRRIS